MEELQFKTNLKCEGCIAAITPVLNAYSPVSEWNVDLSDPDRILTVKGEAISEDELTGKINAAGYTLTRIPSAEASNL